MMQLAPHQLAQLLDHRADPCVSLYVPQSASAVRDENALRFRSALNGAATQIAQQLGTDRLLQESVKLARDLSRKTDAPFWTRSAARPFWRAEENYTAAVMLAPGFLFKTQLATALPRAIHVDDRFQTLPLLAHSSLDVQRYFLALSFHKTSLYRISAEGLNRLPGAVPARLEQVAGAFTEPSPLQFRSLSVGTGRSVAFHGHSDRQLKQRLEGNFLQAVATALEAQLPQRAVLYLGGVASTRNRLLPMLGSIDYAAAFVEGSLDDKPASEIERRVAEAIRQEEDDRLESWLDCHASTRPPLDQPRAVVEAARHGRVDTLVIESGQLLGDGIAEQAARACIANGGEVLDATPTGVSLQGEPMLAFTRF